MTNYIQQYENSRFPFERTESERILSDFVNSATVTDGVVRWNSNNRVPPSDILEFWEHMGKDFDIVKSKAVSKKETSDFLTEYRRNKKPPSEEELFEMRSAFGPGTVIVDVITGRKTKL